MTQTGKLAEILAGPLCQRRAFLRAFKKGWASPSRQGLTSHYVLQGRPIWARPNPCGLGMKTHGGREMAGLGGRAKAKAGPPVFKTQRSDKLEEDKEKETAMNGASFGCCQHKHLVD